MPLIDRLLDDSFVWCRFGDCEIEFVRWCLCVLVRLGFCICVTLN